MVTFRGLYGEENEELLFSGHRVSIWEDKIPEVDGGDGCIRYELRTATEMFAKIIEMLHFVTYFSTIKLSI